ncbi:sulfur carrier protein ThiS [Synechococcus sp. H55.7]|uniref:sulfur carrier protein ThiS n=1 Tax=unclassified Synechococcus TaxID=2626047 RepID=UPI0039C2A924
MRVLINQKPYDLPEGTTLAEAIAQVEISGPFAVAVNLEFVPRAQYERTRLQEGDQVEIVAPVAGG